MDLHYRYVVSGLYKFPGSILTTIVPFGYYRDKSEAEKSFYEFKKTVEDIDYDTSLYDIILQIEFI